MAVIDEHFVPDEGVGIEEYLVRGDRTAVHHLVRYEWACAVLDALNPRPASLLDIACGAGYGSRQIAERFPDTEVVGADYDDQAVVFAGDQYGRDHGNLSYQRGDVVRWRESLGDRMFDCIVSFDTIEHVEHREVMMQNMVEHLAPGGMLLLSTPVRSETVFNPGWEHHKIEYSPGALFDFLSRYFEEVLYPDNQSLPCRDVIDRLNRADNVVYLMRMNPVVCRMPRRMSKPTRV
jgi:SAM-dependent methyltransferase